MIFFCVGDEEQSGNKLSLTIYTNKRIQASEMRVLTSSLVFYPSHLLPSREWLLWSQCTNTHSVLR